MNRRSNMTASDSISVSARPEAMSLDPQHAAVIVVDMQNGFAKPGGFLERRGMDISGAPAVIANCSRVIATARQRGMRIIHLQMGWHPQMYEMGAPRGGNWHKSMAWRFMRDRPENAGTAITRGTWDYAIIDELAPQPGDIVIPKTKQSGFFDTNLDSVLRNLGIRTLAFVGIATNVCVEATLRDASYRDYLCLLVADASDATGPDYVKQATMFNVEMILGWVTTTDEFVAALAP
ncbi:MAG: isochorismatase family protein [Betaproteobacteria bacterium]|nr:isochorismatase family protein [Betaproteobacteria bacterium]